MKSYETERLLFRPYSESDLEDNYTFMGHFENVQYLMTDAQSREQCHAFIRYAIQKTDENPCNEYHFAVVLKEQNKMIGSCCLSVTETRQGGMSWVIHRDFQGNGYGGELGGFLLKFAFEELQLRRVIASCDTRNVPSYRIMEKLGMRREGHFIQGRSPSKREPDFFGDEYAYGIVRDEYMK